MITQENKSKLPQRIGDKGLNKLLKKAIPATQPEQTGTLESWGMPGAVNVGIQGRDGFRPMHNMIMLAVSREYRRRLGTLGEEVFREAVFALRTIMQCRMKSDFPERIFAIGIVQPRGDLCVTVDGDVGNEYMADPRVLQNRLDDACAKFADCLGV